MPRFFLAALLALSPALTSGAGDKIILNNEDEFTGKVVALKDGLIELVSPHSSTPLQVLNKDLKQLSFAAASEEEDTEDLQKDPQHLTLLNGDSFPGKVVSLNDTHLGFQTWFAGTLEIPRELIDSVVFGVTPQPTVYQGPRNLDGWDQDPDGPWTLIENALVSGGTGFIGKNVLLPSNFIFSTTIEWNASPNVRLHLCTDRAEPVGKTIGDGYLVTINTAGIQVSRANPGSASSQKYSTLIYHSAKLNDLALKKIRLELRVNRQTGTLQLYLDDRKLEQGSDPQDAPAGTSLIIESNSSTPANIEIRNITVQEWDSTTERITREPRESYETDTLAVQDGDRYSGKIIGYDPDGPEQNFTVKSPLSPDPIKIPASNCAVLYFASPEDPPSSLGQYQLDLRPGGHLTISAIQLGEEKLITTHPWLGDLQVDRRVMSSITKGK